MLVAIWLQGARLQKCTILQPRNAIGGLRWEQSAPFMHTDQVEMLSPSVHLQLGQCLPRSSKCAIVRRTLETGTCYVSASSAVLVSA